jgi:hypothetical protein
MGLYIDNVKMGKPYINGVKHNAYIGGQKIWEDVPQLFSITVQDNGSFNVPLRGVNGGASVYQPYNWLIDWGDGNIEPVSGTGGSSASIAHTYTDGLNTHTIIIEPNGTTQGWLNAFGTGNFDATNSAKIKSINSKINRLMRTAGQYSHYQMFRSCVGLTSIPEDLLPATVLTGNCYRNMFYGCNGLTSIPEKLLPSLTLADGCYMYMFGYCAGINSIPENLLPATDLVANCYRSMFEACNGLTSIPEKLLPAMTINSGSYQNMFSECTKLTSIPEKLLPSMELFSYCYYMMFYNCTGLTSIPEDFLPAITLFGSCYYSMFRGCKGLTSIGNIDSDWFSARTPEQAYMFMNDTLITTPIAYSDIPAGWK